MSEVVPATEQAPGEGTKVNRVGLGRAEYKGSKSTLCPGCGHDAITNHIISAFYDLGVRPHEVIKLSGIGCSSKTPAYFLQKAHGFNAVHGRMPSIATGAVVANQKLKAIGVSGDGDTASIGIGQFMHLIRRDLPLVYIIENNGVYGLTKGQFSATADSGSVQKKGEVNEHLPIDTCAVAVTLGCTFVARAFSGDGKQVVPLLQAAMSHKGTAVIDIISPCVTFNNHEGSTKSYQFVKDHDIKIHEIGYVPSYEEIHVDYEPGTAIEVALHDGSRMVLKKLDRDYDPHDKINALRQLQEAQDANQLLTGLLYVNPKRRSYLEQLNMVDQPLVHLPESKLRPSKEALAEIMESLT